MVILLLAGVQGAAQQSVQDAMHPAPSPIETAQRKAAHGEEEREIYGQLAQTVTSFVGEWPVTLDGQTQITVVLTPKTDVRKFKRRLPEPGTWLRAKGVMSPDGRLDAKIVRPDDSEPNQVVVRLKPSADSFATAQALASEYEMSVRAILPSADIYLFTTREDEEDAQERLLNDDRVLWAELNRVSRVPTGFPYRTWKWGSQEDSNYVNQQAFEQVNLTPVVGVVNGDGVTVAVLDTGVDLEHPALVDALHIVASSDMISDTDRPDDIGPGTAWGHGTHIAGVIHAIAPAARIMPLRVLDAQGRGNTFVLAYAIEYAIQQGADVINLSLGADCDSRTLAETIAAAVAQGVVIVAAAGNDASVVPSCPASLPWVMAVAAVDEQRVRTSWSNYGPWIALAAPGEGITSTFPLGYAAEIDASPGYASWSGTSMAAPFVAGA
ncbi:S8 family serine peptidase, partial [Caldilinea sp.]|uniref:S8 family serine peptidase n=1 Tax=Caldilinea sp. TaxID=2293560 RepID=UPI00261B52B4